MDMEIFKHRPKQGAIFAWGQQSGAWGRAGNANFLGVKATLLGVFQYFGFSVLETGFLSSVCLEFAWGLLGV